MSNEESARVRDAVTAAVPRIEDVTVIAAQDGLRTGRNVEVTTTEPVPLTVEELRAVLQAVWKNASSEPSSVKLQQWAMAGGEKEAVLFDEAADELGVKWGTFFGGASFRGASLAHLFGEWRPAS